MQEFIDSHRIESYCPEVGHHVAHLCGVEGHAHRTLHPCVCNKNPECRQAHAYCREPRRCQMKAAAHLVPAEEHDCHECGFHKECHNAFDCKGRSEDIAHKPAVIAPVGAEFKFEDNAGGHAAGKVDAEEGHPEFGNVFPFHVAGAHVDGFHQCHYQRQPDGERYKQPVVHGCEGELGPRPVDEVE